MMWISLIFKGEIMKFHNSIILVIAQTLFWPSLFSTFNQTSFDKNVALYGNKTANLMELQNVTQQLNQKIVRPVIKAPLFTGSADKDAQEALQKQAFIEKRKTQLLIKKASSSTLQDVTQKIDLASVKLSYAVPAFLGVSDRDVQDYLQQQGVFAAIKTLWTTFQNNQTIEETTITPQAASALTSIQEKIRTAFSGETGHVFNLENTLAQTNRQEFNNFLTQAKSKNQLLMVRSTGKEDSKGNVNAGGNESISAVAPDGGAITKAMGEVVASYFSQRSISQRLMAKDPGLLDTQAPFFMPVLIQVMIGETIGGSTHQNDIPVSGVMFSREAEGRTPGVTHIQATYGHNEGIVNGTVAFDTFYIGSSLIVHPLIQIKRMRLVPVHGSLLEKRDNPAALQRIPCLSFEQLKALKKCADTIETYYNEPDGVDIEFVVKHGTVYIVQARPVAHKKSEPSYIQKDYLQTSSPADTIPLTVISAGGGQAHILDNDQSILVADTIGEAYDTFLYTIKNKEAIKTVLLGQMAPSMSHEVNMLRGAGIQVAYLENLEIVRTWLKEVTTHPLIIDTQRELIVKFVPVEQFTSAAQALQQGWFTHPIAKKVSVFTLFNTNLSAQQIAQLKPEMPLVQADFQTLINQIQEADTQEAQAALKILLLRVGRRIIMEKQSKKTEIDPTIQADLSNVFAQLRTAAYEAYTALETWEKSGKTPQDRIARLYPVTFIQALIQQLPIKNLFVNDYSFGSLLKTEKQEQVLAEELALTGVETARIIQYAKASHYALTDEVQKEWQTFLKVLSLVADPVLHNDFATVMYNVASMDILPLWINTSFAQATQKTLTTQDSDTAIKGAGEIATTLIQEFNASKTFIDELQKKKAQLTALSVQSWENPLTFNKTWAAFYAEFVEYFASKDFINNYEAAPELGKFAALSLMQFFVSTFDTSIKTLEASKAYGKDAKNKKIQNFKTMLDGYFSVLEQWAMLLEQDTEFVKNLLNRKVYLQNDDEIKCSTFQEHFTEIQRLLSIATLELTASPQFNVAGAALGSQANWWRSLGDLPTLEDIFSLTHQNLLVILGALTQKTSLASMPEPLMISKLKEEIISQKGPKVTFNLIGINFTQNMLTYYYNMPLRNHSNTFQIIYHLKNKKTEVVIQFIGEARDRWQALLNHLPLATKLFDLNPSITPNLDSEKGMVSFGWFINTDHHARAAALLLDAFNNLANNENYFLPRIMRSDLLATNEMNQKRALKVLEDRSVDPTTSENTLTLFSIALGNKIILSETTIKEIITLIEDGSLENKIKLKLAKPLVTNKTISLSPEQIEVVVNYLIEATQNTSLSISERDDIARQILTDQDQLKRLSDQQKNMLINVCIEYIKSPRTQALSKATRIEEYLTKPTILLSEEQKNSIINELINLIKTTPAQELFDWVKPTKLLLINPAITLSEVQKETLIQVIIELLQNPSFAEWQKEKLVELLSTAPAIKLSDEQKKIVQTFLDKQKQTQQ
jgi:hypothetical protein